MKSSRYRRPSLNTILGITTAKKRVEKELGITDAMKPPRWWTNTKRRFKRKIGRRAIDSEWVAETRRVFGGGGRDWGCIDRQCRCDAEII